MPLSQPYEPQDVTRLDIAFGVRAMDLMPDYESIPDDFPERRKWVDFQQQWFFGGLGGDTEIEPKDGIDPARAMRHLAVIQGSFEPKHEHKEAAVAYLASLWFEDVKVVAKKRGA